MENAIFKAGEQLQNGFKQIYPNNNNVEISMKSWTPVWYGEVEWQWTGAGMGSSFNVEYSSKVADVFLTEEEAFEFSKARKLSNEENAFFDTYSKIQIKHAISNRVLDSLSFTKYSLVELLNLVNIYRSENTPIKVTVVDYDGNEITWAEIEKELERFSYRKIL